MVFSNVFVIVRAASGNNRNRSRSHILKGLFYRAGNSSRAQDDALGTLNGKAFTLNHVSESEVIGVISIQTSVGPSHNGVHAVGSLCNPGYFPAVLHNIPLVGNGHAKAVKLVASHIFFNLLRLLLEQSEVIASKSPVNLGRVAVTKLAAKQAVTGHRRLGSVLLKGAALLHYLRHYPFHIWPLLGSSQLSQSLDLVILPYRIIHGQVVGFLVPAYGACSLHSLIKELQKLPVDCIYFIS